MEKQVLSVRTQFASTKIIREGQCYTITVRGPSEDLNFAIATHANRMCRRWVEDVLAAVDKNKNEYETQTTFSETELDLLGVRR